MAIKSPHMTPGLAPKVNAGKITAFGGVRAARDRHVSDDVQEQKLDAMHHEKDCKLETDYQSKKTYFPTPRLCTVVDHVRVFA